MEQFKILEERATRANLIKFADQLLEISGRIGFKVSARGWAYQLEQAGIINKGQFDRIETVINACRKKGILPIDFVAEEEGRQFSGVESETNETPMQYLKGYVASSLDCSSWYTPDWWKNEQCYIQMLVEKIDLKTLFEPVCHNFHIPIATSKGWSSMLQRAQYAQRFKEAQDRGLKCVLLYCGDHDPDGLRISDFLRSNLEDIQSIVWSNGNQGYDPSELVIERFGLDAAFIRKHKLTWIDNLITGSNKDLGSPKHKNFKMPYVKNYIKQFGKKKCEANAIVPMPDEARALVEGAIIKHVGPNALKRFEKLKREAEQEIEDIVERNDLEDKIDSILRDLE